eukprot:CAMPEP_0115465376 /NCGR_PEP_ID=MMETSP0271-20121206/49370_1 /TAXON_ID=71861 /ORGANISM="Scrippsiella trochoidea, Strain CCMP3099" /LENGTH=138 /DNA_ID=CAMNT_0002892317 /DNA_START=140 /DNA_END=556 /DNA_ORIENTATION=-
MMAAVRGVSDNGFCDNSCELPCTASMTLATVVATSGVNGIVVAAIPATTIAPGMSVVTQTLLDELPKRLQTNPAIPIPPETRESAEYDLARSTVLLKSATGVVVAVDARIDSLGVVTLMSSNKVVIASPATGDWHSGT